MSTHVQEETRDVTSRRKDMTLNASLRRHDEARERASATESVLNRVMDDSS